MDSPATWYPNAARGPRPSEGAAAGEGADGAVAGEGAAALHTFHFSTSVGIPYILCGNGFRKTSLQMCGIPHNWRELVLRKLGWGNEDWIGLVGKQPWVKHCMECAGIR